MEDFEKKSAAELDKEICFSKSIKAGKRIYYVDVKKSKRDELFLSITESKRIPLDGNEDGPYSFEKHKIFIYQEDFGKFIDALSNAVRFIHENKEALPVDAVSDGNADLTAEECDVPDADDAAADIEEASVSDDLPEKIELKIDF